MKTLKAILILTLGLWSSVSWGQIYHESSYTIPCEFSDQSLSYDSITGQYHFHGNDGESPKFKTLDHGEYLWIDADYCYLEPHVYFPAIVDGKYGAINMKGNILIPFKYDGLKYDSTNDTYFLKRKEKWFKTKGKGKKKVPGEVLGFIEEFAIVKSSNKKVYFLHEHGSKQESVMEETQEQFIEYTNMHGKIGIVTTDGLIITEPTFDEVEIFYTYVIARIDDKYAVLDLEGLVTEFKFDAINYCGKLGFAQYLKDGKYGLLNIFDGVEITEAIYDDIYCGSDAIIIQIGDLNGFINYRGEIITEPIYDGVFQFKNGLAAVGKDGKWGFINKKGELVIDHQFTLFCSGMSFGMYFHTENEATVCLDEECIIIDSTGKKISSCPEGDPGK